jgi:hypothetical protein
MKRTFTYSKEEIRGEAQSLANETGETVIFYPQAHENGEWDYMKRSAFEKNRHVFGEDHEMIEPM